MEKRLYRTPRNKVIGGVAGGLAEYFDIDPVIVRVIFVVTALAWGVSIIAYILLWIIVPENPKNRQEEFLSDLEPDYIREAEELYEKDKKSNRKFVGGIILVAFGTVLLLKKLLPAMEWSYILPFFIILIGGYIIYTAYNSQNRGEEL